MAKGLLHTLCPNTMVAVRIGRQQRTDIHAAVQQFSPEAQVRERMGVQIDEPLQSSASSLLAEDIPLAVGIIEHEAVGLATTA